MVNLNTCIYIIKMHPFIWLKTKPNFSIGFCFPLCCNRPLQIAYTYSTSFCIGTLTRFGPKAMLQLLTSHVKLIKKVKMGVWAYDAVPYLTRVFWTLLKWVIATQRGKLHQLRHRLGQADSNAMKIIWVWM